MIDELTMALGIFLFAYGVVVLHKMKANSSNARGCGWLMTTIGAFGMIICGISKQNALEYYIITILGIAILCACGFRSGISNKEQCRNGTKI